MKKKHSVYTAFGKTISFREAVTYQKRHQNDQRADVLARTFDLPTALAYHDHEYALYPLSNHAVVQIRLVGSPWKGDTSHVSPGQYRVKFFRVTDGWHDAEQLAWESESKPFSEAELTALLASIGLSPTKSCWLSADIWDFAAAQQQQHFVSWLQEEVRKVREHE